MPAAIPQTRRIRTPPALNSLPGVEFPDVFELQTPKTKVDECRIVETFRPYLEARDWVSINRGKVVGFTADGFEAVGPSDGRRVVT